MAHRDRTQGFGFMYVDISKLLRERKESKESDLSAPVLTNNVKHANFNKDAATVAAKAASMTSLVS